MCVAPFHVPWAISFATYQKPVSNPQFRHCPHNYTVGGCYLGLVNRTKEVLSRDLREGFPGFAAGSRGAGGGGVPAWLCFLFEAGFGAQRSSSSGPEPVLSWEGKGAQRVLPPPLVQMPLPPGGGGSSWQRCPHCAPPTAGCSRLFGTAARGGGENGEGSASLLRRRGTGRRRGESERAGVRRDCRRR